MRVFAWRDRSAVHGRTGTKRVAFISSIMGITNELRRDVLADIDAEELRTTVKVLAQMLRTLERLEQQGIEPERPPYQVSEGGSWLCFVQDPDGYRIELIGRS